MKELLKQLVIDRFEERKEDIIENYIESHHDEIIEYIDEKLDSAAFEEDIMAQIEDEIDQIIDWDIEF